MSKTSFFSYFNDAKRKIKYFSSKSRFSWKIVVITSILQFIWQKFYFKQRICRLACKWQSNSLRKHRSFEIVLQFHASSIFVCIDPIFLKLWEASRVFFRSLSRSCDITSVLLDFELWIKKRVLNSKFSPVAAQLKTWISRHGSFATWQTRSRPASTCAGDTRS